MNETSRERRANDYRELMSMQGPLLEVVPKSGTPPYVESYDLYFNIPTYVSTGSEPSIRSRHHAVLTFPAGYPCSDFPRLVMVSKPYPFHPNWFRSGAWCYGAGSHCTEGAGNYVVRVMQTLQYDENIIDELSPANGDALDWYRRNKNKPGMFPCDTTKLPQPVVGGMMIKRVNKY